LPKRRSQRRTTMRQLRPRRSQLKKCMFLHLSQLCTTRSLLPTLILTFQLLLRPSLPNKFLRTSTALGLLVTLSRFRAPQATSLLVRRTPSRVDMPPCSSPLLPRVRPSTPSMRTSATSILSTITPNLSRTSPRTLVLVLERLSFSTRVSRALVTSTP